MCNIPILIILIDSNGVIRNYECRFDEMICYTPEEIIGKNWFDVFIDENDKDKIRPVFKDIMNNHPEEYLFFRNDILSKDGRHILLDFHNRLISLNDKKYIFSIAIEHLHFDQQSFEEMSKEIENIYLQKWFK